MTKKLLSLIKQKKNLFETWALFKTILIRMPKRTKHTLILGKQTQMFIDRKKLQNGNKKIKRTNGSGNL